jgi:hypothetical protein
MILASRVPNLKNVCGIAIDLSAIAVPSYSTANQNFYDSYLLESNAKGVYFGKRSVRFSEQARSTRAGFLWQTTVEIQFPATDHQRAHRLEEFCKAKYIVVQLNSGHTFYLGRNDWYQNAAPKIEIQSDAHLAKVKFNIESIMPSGFLPEYNGQLLPHDVPVNLMNS